MSDVVDMFIAELIKYSFLAPISNLLSSPKQPSKACSYLGLFIASSMTTIMV